MKTQTHTETGESTADGDLWLDQYPAEVLEAVLRILKAQHVKLRSTTNDNTYDHAAT